jgi:hypothetical protein
MSAETDAAGFRAEYWDWVAVALFLLVPVDLQTTLFAAETLGHGGEANPVVAWMLTLPLGSFVAVNLCVLVLAGAFFHGLHETMVETPEPYDRYFEVGVETWLGTLVAVGLFVFANNLAAIVHGTSLL